MEVERRANHVATGRRRRSYLTPNSSKAVINLSSLPLSYDIRSSLLPRLRYLVCYLTFTAFGARKFESWEWSNCGNGIAWLLLFSTVI
ncbi:hypothetical protein BHE74_00051538 [Ensete ventricosum]|nr:hypothetical protein BHE74_00051538 [Ensete ventricosum]